MHDETAAIVHRFLLRWHGGDPPEPAVAALLIELGPREALPAVLERVVDRAERGLYRSGELAKALSLWHAAATRPPPRAPLPLRPSWVQLGLGVALMLAGADAVRRHWVPPPPARVHVVPLTARSEPMPEPRVADGIAFAPDQARAAVEWVNAASPEVLRRAGVPQRAADAIQRARPFVDVDVLAATPGVGPATMEAIRRATQ